MNWYTKIDGTDWRIEMNGLTDTTFASLDKSFYRITMKTAGKRLRLMDMTIRFTTPMNKYFMK